MGYAIFKLGRQATQSVLWSWSRKTAAAQNLVRREGVEDESFNPSSSCPWLCLRPPCGLTKDSPGADVCAGQPPGLGVKKRKKPRIIIIPILQTMKWRDREAKYLALNPTGDKSQSQDSDSGSLRTPQHYVLKHVLKQVSILRVAIYCLLPNLFVWNIEIRESQPEKLN